MVRAAWARASDERRCNLTEPHAVHRWEMLRDRLPAVALVLAHPQRPRRRPEREPVPRLVHVERVAIGEIVGVLLRQSLREHLEAFAPFRVRATTTRPFTGMRCSSLTPGTNQ